MREWMVACAVAALLATACASSPSDTAEPRQNTGSVAASAPASPLADLIGFSTDVELNRQRFAAIQTQSDALVADCMSAQGLEWLPTPPVPGSALAPGNRRSLAWARAHGLGVTDQLTVQARSNAADPNAGHLQTLSDVEQDRWRTALFGDTSALGADTEAPVVYEPAGCLGQAFSASRDSFEVYQTFEPELDVLSKRITADPRMVINAQAWTDCMESAGYVYEDPQAMRDDILNRLLEIGGVAELMAAPATSPRTALTEMFERVDDVELGALVASERELAVADVNCSAPRASEADEIRDSYEREFIIDHRPRIEATLAEINAQR